MAVLATLLVAGGGGAVGLATATQHHAPAPTAAAAGSLTPTAPTEALPDRHGLPTRRPARAPHTLIRALPASTPTSLTIPAIGVHSDLQPIGQNPDGTIAVPPLDAGAATNQAAWYRYSATPGQNGAALIEGHIDSAADGPSVFYRLGDLTPGDTVTITRTDHTTAVFTITAVRQYAKTAFPTSMVYTNPGYPALRLITCGGTFDHTTLQYLSNTVVFANLTATDQPGTSMSRTGRRPA